MKYFMCFAVIASVISVACAHPGAAAVAAAGSAAVSGAAAETGDPAKIAAQITKFMDIIKEACEKFVQGIFGGSGASPLGALPAGPPGMSKLFHPLDAGKHIFGNILKDFGGAGPSDQKGAAAAAASSGASAAASNGKSDAAAASGAAAKTGDGTKDLNPLVVGPEITKFMATIEEACEKFIQGIFGGSGAGPLGALPAGIPGMSKLFNPLDAGKHIFGNILKDFGGADASPSDQKVASAAAAGSASAAIAKKKDKAAVPPGGMRGKPRMGRAKGEAAIKATTGKPDMVASLENAGSGAFSDLFGDFGF